MKNKNYILVVLIGVIALIISCQQDNLEGNLLEKGDSDTYLTIEEAKSFFENQTFKTTRSNNNEHKWLTPGDFTPLWDEAMVTHNSTVANADVPILSQYRYKAIRSEITKGTAQAYTASITQKLVITKSIKNKRLGQYLITFIPDNDFKAKKRNINYISTNNKRINNFSGWMLYSLPQIKCPIKIEKYESGKKVTGIIIPPMKGKSQLSMKTIQKIMGNMKFAVSRNVQTRSYEDFWDWFENEIFPDAEHGDHFEMNNDGDNWWLEDENGDKIEIPDGLIDETDTGIEEEPESEEDNDNIFGPSEDNSGTGTVEDSSGLAWLEIYHVKCNTYLGMIQLDDTEKKKFYCSKCKVYVTVY